MNNIKVFNPRMQVDVFVDWFGYPHLNNYEWTPTDSIEETFNQPIRIACLPVWFDRYDHYKNYPFDVTKFDLVLLSDIEHNSIKDIKLWIDELKIKNYLLALGGFTGPYDTSQLNKDAVYRPWWSFNIIDQNEFQDTRRFTKKLDFDVLLGAKKPHRDFVMAKMQNSNLIDNSIVNYRDEFNVFGARWYHEKLTPVIKNILNDQVLNFPYVSPNLQQEWEVRENITNNVSDRAPWKIYEKTKYSIICETLFENDFFLTEKTGKALFCKRLFVVFSTCNFLKNIKSLGFKTFDSIVDESYDSETDTVKRFELAFDQIQWLAKQDYSQIIKKATPILDHNHNHLIKYKEEIKTQMLEMVYNKIKEIK